MLFCCNTDEEKISLPGGAAVCAEFADSPHACGGFSGDPDFLSHPKDVHMRKMSCPQCPHLSVGVSGPALQGVL